MLPKTAQGAYADIRRRYLPDLPPPSQVTFKWITPLGTGEFLDTRCELGSMMETEKGKWLIELDGTFKGISDITYWIVGHEALHMIYGPTHKSKEWNQGVRKLTGAGFFSRIF
jgi:hypothetical protein